MFLNFNRKGYFLCFLLTFGGLSSLPAQDTVKVGLFVTNLYDFDIANDSYTVEFWTWSLHSSDSVSFEENQEISNSKKTHFTNFSVEKSEGIIWEQKKCLSTIMHDWDVSNFPFDKQSLVINVEEVLSTAEELCYIPDYVNTNIKNTLQLDEWNIDSFTTIGSKVTYNTTYGDPGLVGESVYPAVETTIYISRTHGWTTFFKLTMGVFVAFFISLLVFKIVPPEPDTRLGLAVGGLFAAVGNKYIVESIVPTSTQTTLIDQVHLVTFGAILFIVIMVIYNARLHYFNQHELANKMDTYCFVGSLIAYLALIGFFVGQAMV